MVEVGGVAVGHWTDARAGTGCTVAVFEPRAVCGVDVRGGAPGTRETALLDPVCQVDRVDAIVLTGGSALGLASAVRRSVSAERSKAKAIRRRPGPFQSFRLPWCSICPWAMPIPGRTRRRAKPHTTRPRTAR